MLRVGATRIQVPNVAVRWKFTRHRIPLAQFAQRPEVLQERVKAIKLAIPAFGSSGCALRNFIRDELPLLKYHNPNVAFSWDKSLDYKKPSIFVDLADSGETDKLHLTKASVAQISSTLLQKYGVAQDKDQGQPTLDSSSTATATAASS
mmetsp:Transcript_15110/g.25862  ORF Transcript_15110/g.25862 Transcript_15110/m.25862 type:complete len:149 (-) Transcript_15110:91-537(-)